MSGADAPRARRVGPRGVAALVLIGALAVWLLAPLLRARVHLARGDPGRAWQAALSAGDSSDRDELLERILLAPVAPAGGSYWDAVVARDPRAARDPRLPAWLAFGPHGRDVRSFIGEIESWPILACLGEVDPVRAAPALEFRWVEPHPDQPARRLAEEEAFAAAYSGAVDRIVALERAAAGAESDASASAEAAASATESGDPQDALRLAAATSAGHLAAAAATEIYAGGREAPARLRLLAMALRAGHLPDPGAVEQHVCVLCDRGGELAPGVVARGAGLEWISPAGKTVQVPEAGFLPRR